MKCPHCRQGFHDNYKFIHLENDINGSWFVIRRLCPECNKLTINLAQGKEGAYNPIANPGHVHTNIMVWPKGSSRPPCPQEVLPGFAEDYTEACLVLNDSPKASAAPSRRCLQYILREKAGVKPSNLADEIQETLDRNLFPSYIASIVDAVRNIGNFAAHPTKSINTGEIIDVEPGEAELNLGVIEALFDFYFVSPALVAKKKAAINEKLQDAGKPPMKE
ncbi:DUF4145 domain-containing protein [Chloroflexota bacterium]